MKMCELPDLHTRLPPPPRATWPSCPRSDAPQPQQRPSSASTRECRAPQATIATLICAAATVGRQVDSVLRGRLDHSCSWYPNRF